LVAAAQSVQHRTHDLRADAVANLLRVTMAERLALGLRTIGACDVTPAERRRIMKEKKMRQDRERQSAKRNSEGRKSRSEYEKNSLSQQRPWEAEGISRRTWERRRDASVSKVDSNQIGDTLASIATERAVDQHRPEASASHHIQEKNCTELRQRRVAEPPQRSEEAQQSVASPKGAAVVDLAIRTAIEAAFQRLHDPNTRWLPAPGSSTYMIAA